MYTGGGVSRARDLAASAEDEDRTLCSPEVRGLTEVSLMIEQPAILAVIKVLRVHK
jgi:hypothetical protein